MRELDYFIVDVFTERPMEGNPLAVVMDSVGLAPEKMQAIAREFNLSETTFVQRRASEIERAEGIRVRIFTTQEELPFAGHPTLGTASVLRSNAPETIQNHELTLALQVGPIKVRFESGAGFAEMTQRDPEFGQELDPGGVAPLLGVAPRDLHPDFTPQVVSTESGFAIVVLRDLDSLGRLRVKHEEATPWLRDRGGRWFYVLAPTAEQEPAYRARMQFDGGEDPATGSAAGCAISYLVARAAVASDRRIMVRQGVEIGRTSTLFLRAKIDSARVFDVRVGGSTVPVAKGRLFLE